MNKINQEALAVKRAEQLFDRRRRTIGLFGGPLLALLVFFTPIAGLTLEARINCSPSWFSSRSGGSRNPSPSPSPP